MTWTLARAKDQLSEVIRQAVSNGPQMISVRGEDTAVVIAKADYDRLAKPLAPPKTFKDFLLSIPSLEDVDLTRDQTPPRDVDL
jgi:antitoxin Phd